GLEFRRVLCRSEPPERPSRLRKPGQSPVTPEPPPLNVARPPPTLPTPARLSSKVTRSPLPPGGRAPSAGRPWSCGRCPHLVEPTCSWTPPAGARVWPGATAGTWAATGARARSRRGRPIRPRSEVEHHHGRRLTRDGLPQSPSTIQKWRVLPRCTHHFWMFGGGGSSDPQGRKEER